MFFEFLGRVVGIEHIEKLVDVSLNNIKKNNAEMLGKNLDIYVGDGRKGYAIEAPYDCIHVGAAASSDVCDVLCDQLKIGGKLVIPVDKYSEYGQDFTLIEKNEDGSCLKQVLGGVIYVPLTDRSRYDL